MNRKVMVEAPERIWIEAGDECPYFYEAHELHDVEQDVIEYVRADLYAALEAQLAARIGAAKVKRLIAELEQMTESDLIHLREVARDEIKAIIAALEANLAEKDAENERPKEDATRWYMEARATARAALDRMNRGEAWCDAAERIRDFRRRGT